MAKKRKRAVVADPAGSDEQQPSVEEPADPAGSDDQQLVEEPVEKEEQQSLAPAPAAAEPVLDASVEAEEFAGGDDGPCAEDPSAPQATGNGWPEPVYQHDGFDGEDRDLESIQKLLDPFPKDQLVELLGDAAAVHADVLVKIYRLADAEPAHRKIFVHGLGWDTTAEVLVAAFREFGEIEDCKAVTDHATGRSKGYGFILFKHRSGACRALKEPQKKIGNRMTSCQLASIGPPGPPPPPPVSEYTQRKIYISNVGAELDPQKLLQFFAKFGEIEEGPLGLDKATGKPKGFCLFVYKDVESAKKVLEEPHKNFEGHVLHCQRAIDGPKLQKSGFHFGGGLGHVHPQVSPYTRTESAKFIGGPGGGHLMAPSAAQHAAAAGLNPALGQALTAMLAVRGTGLGVTNLLGSFGSTGVVNQGVQPPMANNGHGMQYGGPVGSLNAGMGGYGPYGPQGPIPGGYGGAPMGHGGAGRPGHTGGYMGH